MNHLKLRKAVDSSGLKKMVIADKINMCPYTLQLKLDGIRDFKVNELNALVNVLRVPFAEKCEIFFTDCVDCKTTQS